MTGAELIAEYADYRNRADDAETRLFRAVRAYAMSVTRDEDLAQEATMLVFRFLGQYNDERGSFASWVRTIIDNCRRQRHRDRDNHLVPVTDDFLADLDHQMGDQATRTPELLRELLLHGPPQARQLLSTALAARTGSLHEAGKLLGLTRQQVDYQRRLLKNFAANQQKGATDAYLPVDASHPLLG
jgi:RNA polymerase sigma factor (sigma-70 family)